MTSTAYDSRTPRHPHRRARAAAWAGVVGTSAAVALACAAAPVNASPPATANATGPHVVSRVVAHFDQAKDQSPEGVTVDHGDRYVSWKPLQQLVRVGKNGAPQVIATLPGHATGIGGLVGLATAPNGDILGALANADARYNGVWEITPTGHSRRLAALPTSAFPNDLVVTRDGKAALVTDSLGGRIFRLDLKTGRVRTIVDSPLLEPAANAPVPIGANGITFLDPRHMVVANTYKNVLLSVPIRNNGTAGRLSVLAHVVHPDGVRAAHGNLFVAQSDQDVVSEIRPNGSWVVLAAARDGLDTPVSLSIRSHSPAGRVRYSILITNAALTPNAHDPNLTRLVFTARNGAVR